MVTRFAAAALSIFLLASQVSAEQLSIVESCSGSGECQELIVDCGQFDCLVAPLSMVILADPPAGPAPAQKTPEQIKQEFEELIKKLKEKLKALPRTDCFGLSQGKVWDGFYYWLKEDLGFNKKDLPGDFQVLDPNEPKNKEFIEKFLQKFKTFLSGKKVKDLKKLTARLRAIFSGKPELLKLLDDIEALLNLLGDDAVIPEYLIQLLHDLLKELIFGSTATAAVSMMVGPESIVCDDGLVYAGVQTQL